MWHCQMNLQVIILYDTQNKKMLTIAYGQAKNTRANNTKCLNSRIRRWSEEKEEEDEEEHILIDDRSLLPRRRGYLKLTN